MLGQMRMTYKMKCPEGMASGTGLDKTVWPVPRKDFPGTFSLFFMASRRDQMIRTQKNDNLQ